ncbi:NAD-dependent epimerase/dehydratase family protein [Derxia gummosa]|uniref:NAD-dependent epimerase/dehydratase family protein n=1 Tax=Derxia gummosa DSM 723 TaxID=1121388 RepID=A0A8B6X0T3_9BURK|nr:NAD-dependent epimerase/dehydratase family protein [Derxia gummosa]
MKSVVIGGAGFVGRAVCNELVARGDTVIALDPSPPHKGSLAEGVQHMTGDVLDKASLRPALEGADEVYLLAARLGTSELETELRTAIHTNVLGAINVFEAAVEARVPRAFLASKPSVWLNVYTITKFAAEQSARLLTRYHPIGISVLRYLNIYGPGQKLYPVRKVLPIFAAQALRGLPLQVYGEGDQTVDMLFVDDAARLTVDVMRAPFDGEVHDCGTGVEMTVLEVARAVNEHFGNRAGIQHVPMRKGETPHTRLVANLDPLRRLLGDDLRFTPWPKALATSLDWYARRPAHEIDAALTFWGMAQPYGMAWTS